MFTINQNLIDDFADKINEKEKKNNKVTSLSSSSTHVQYPSAKAVYDAISEVEASSGGNYIYDFYHDSSTDDIVLEYDSTSGSGSGGSGGSYINDFYGDSSTNELVIDYYNGELTNNHYSLTSSNYNPSIDSTVTLTVTVTDHNGDGVSGESVLVTASEGTFTQLNGSDITSASSVTGTTNSSGQFTLTYSCTEWGLITFSANNTNNQIRVSGWRQLKTFGTTGVVKTNGEYVYIYCADLISNVTSRQTRGIGTVTTGYEPPSAFAVEASQDQAANHKFIVGTNGNISVSNATTSTTAIQVFNSIIYPLI